MNLARLGSQPAPIGNDGIDFSVVRHVAERLRQVPRRLRIRRIALVKDSEGRSKRWIAQVFVKLRELPRRQQALIYDRLRRKRADVAARRQQRLSAFPKKREPPLKPHVPTRRVKWLDKQLPNLRHRL